MGVFRTCGSILSNVVTLGGASELKHQRGLYEHEYKYYQHIHGLISERKQQIEFDLSALGQSISDVQLVLVSVEKILTTTYQLNALQFNKPELLVNQMSMFHSGYSSAFSAGFGGVLGGTAAVGAWGLVSIIGSASTGTAIATLSGAAATNATLAWFGGGALAAGGAGMSGGMMVLGGIVAAPMIFFATKKAYQKAEQLEKATQDLKDAFPELEKLLISASEQQAEVKAYTKQMRTICDNYVFEAKTLMTMIQPNGRWSRLYQWLRRLFRLNVFKPKQQQAIESLAVKTSELLANFSR
ncbi:hypothetical protein [Vibrio crassostreae]|uniref:hypothetical protein n=1 Tax=Vibrio crassostreae TaxID=246167 RepID=UPI000F49B1D7|nr:hypothetical protein [Vibrio crassostreae]ROO74760.1 hypothetical protein EDB57_1197 [Vibrio crassostreae]